ncbi:tripartite tricarboxylate transporter substrate-binding protein [Humitalea sp. 24SJ18S-53]|uniref:tripartite tricarboxylate transporter substrate-binding protein n=1 Tax=Humitalea sp. 24SJ18S-53 TaxID=3422307 RepID=UPI003D66AF51
MPQAGWRSQYVCGRGAPALVDLMGGELDLVCADLQPVIAAHQRDEYRVLGVMGTERSPVLPNVPVFSEVGLPQVVSTNWYASSPSQVEVAPRLSGTKHSFLGCPQPVARAKDPSSVFVAPSGQIIGPRSAQAPRCGANLMPCPA